jgi:hypothetical protein
MPANSPPDSGLSWDGFYRAKVIDNKDPKYQGRVKVWVPDIMPEVDDNRGIWARSANNSIGGRNTEESTDTQYYQGSCLIPTVGSWLFIFFENGNPSQPYYFSSGEFGQSKVPVECQVGSQYWNKWIIFKSRKGHTIIVSDDPDDERTEITGKKRKLKSSDASGNVDSVFTIQQNQSVILIDDRSGNEKILVKDYKGNFINLNTSQKTLDIQMNGDIKIKATGVLSITGQNGIEIKTNKTLNMQAEQDVNLKSSQNINVESTGASINIKSAINANMESGAAMNLKATATLMQSASQILSQSGEAAPALPAKDAAEAAPTGERVDPVVSSPIVVPIIIPIKDSIPSTVRNNQKPPEKTS